MRIGKTGIDACGFTVSLDGKLRLPFLAINQAEIVVAFRPVNVELDATSQNGNGIIQLVQPIVNSTKVDVGPGPL